MIQIAPSILSADFARLGEAVRQLDAAKADMIHIDVMDGHFVPNITIGPAVVAALRPLTELPLDVHLMISDPDKYAEAFAKAGADYITVHLESNAHLHRTLSHIAGLGKKVGLALNPHSAPELIFPVLSMCDLVLVMSVNPGFGGQKFIESSLDKITVISRRIKEKGLKTMLQVDGGINSQTAPQVVAAGANVLVAGSAVFNHPRGIARAIVELRDAQA